MVAKKQETTDQKTVTDQPEEAAVTSLPEVKFFPDMTNIFQQAEDYQSEMNSLSLSLTKASFTELHAVSKPAVELALAALAEAAGVKDNLSDFFETAAPS